MAIGFDKNELRIVNSRLKRLSELPNQDLPKILKAVAKEMKEDVQRAAPVNSGNLRNRSVYTKSDARSAEVWVDTRPTETRRGSRNFNYGRTVEHGRTGRYKTTPYFYKVINRVLGSLVTKINNAVRDAAIKGK